jgi:hypothetical protein
MVETNERNQKATIFQHFPPKALTRLLAVSKAEKQAWNNQKTKKDLISEHFYPRN